MRVRRLRLENFRRYRLHEWEVPDGVTAIVGANGAGKSTLLEAIAFALFGTDALPRGQRDRVRLDAAGPSDPVRVELELELGGQALRIVRELRGRLLAPSCTLEVDGVAVVAPGAHSSEQLTAAIERRLGMDLEAFLTTVVARQGELARLANQSGPERKRMVLRMLGVDRLEAAIEAARRKGGEATAALEAVRAFMAALPDPGAQRQAAEAQASQAAANQAASQATWQAAQHTLAQAAAALAAAEAHAQAVTQARASQAQAAAAAAHAVREAGRCLAAVAAAEPALAAIEAARPLAAELLSREAALAQARQAQQAASQRRQQASLAARQKAVRDRLAAEVAALVPPAPPQPGPGAGELEAAGQAHQAAAAEAAVAARTCRDTEARLLRLGSLGPEQPCPTCEQPLGAHLPPLVGTTRRELEAARVRHTAAAQQSKAAQESLAALQAQAAHASRAAAEATLRAKHAQELAARLAQEEVALEALLLEVGPEAPAPDAAALAAMQGAAEAARRAHEQVLRLEAQAAALPALRAELLRAQENQGQADARLAQADAQLAALGPLRAAEERQAHAAAAATERRAAEAHAAAGHAVQSAAAALASAQALVDQHAALVAQETGHAEQATLWAAAARRGDGLLERFRDHLVARVGPAVAAEASRLLAAFTGGRYTEVLLDAAYEVQVADAGIAHPLSRFSGGEQDVVHLALRLAVSRLLAERGGTELRFLALDEPFGSLDRSRREAVVAALQGLGNLYSQVLVVSHLDALHDALGQALVVAAPESGNGAGWAEMREGRQATRPSGPPSSPDAGAGTSEAFLLHNA